MTVREAMHRRWPRTDDDLGVKFVDWETVFIPDAVALVLDRLYTGFGLPVPVGVDDQPRIVQQFVADSAVIELIPVAKNYYMYGTLTTSTSFELGGSTSVGQYNLLQALDQLEGYLDRELGRTRAEVTDILNGVVEPVGGAGQDVPVVSTAGMLFDPVERAAWRGRGY